MSGNFVYLALGSNLGDRRRNLEISIQKLEENGVKFVETSPIYRTPALLLKGSPNEWNLPFLNCIIKVATDLSPENLLILCKKIEKEMGRDLSLKWAPRVIDIDILTYKDMEINTSINGGEYLLKGLTIPHKAIFDRYFLRDELSFIAPEYLGGINYYGGEHQPVFMGIINITPDSFSDGGIHNNINNFRKTFELWKRELVSIIDIGAESTRPNATPLEAKDELERLEPIFEYLKNRERSYFEPLLSIDTYHYETAKQAILNGFNTINDVNALKDERMIELLQNDRKLKYVLTHSLSVPPKKDLVINNIDEIKNWLEEKLNLLERKNISKEQIIFDVGIGFGKTPSQLLQIMQNIQNFQRYGVKILIGHSRKSFMKIFNNDIETPDFETLAISLKLANKVDILRVHTPIEHQNALLAYQSLNNQFV